MNEENPPPGEDQPGEDQPGEDQPAENQSSESSTEAPQSPEPDSGEEGYPQVGEMINEMEDAVIVPTGAGVWNFLPGGNELV